ncbi:MAG: hypothetical protein HDQ88_03140 [Clostridia bacterium]|nr:hypothetical protein [Clostridia bacterium]
MKNKTLLKVIATFTIGSTVAFGLAFGGCTDGDTHMHEYAENWTQGETTHWHVATCDDLNEGDAAYKKDEAPHVDADKDGKCDVCNYAIHDHAFNKEAWNWDGDSHWHPATCDEHKFDFTVKDEAAEHTYGEGENANKCTVCGFEKQDTSSEEKPEVESHQLTLGEEGTTIETLTTGASLILDNKCQEYRAYQLSCDDPHVRFYVRASYEYSGNPVTFTYIKSPLAPNGPTITVTLISVEGDEDEVTSLSNVKIYLTNSQVEGTEITELGDYGSDTDASYFTQMIYKLVVPAGKTYRVTNKENADFIVSTSIVEGEVHHNSAFDTESGTIDLAGGRTYYIGIYSKDGISTKAWITVSDVTD